MADLTNTNVARNYGKVAAGAFYGYQPKFFLVAGTNVGTADSTNESTGVTTLGNFSKAVVALEAQASVVFVGPRADGGFVVAVDGPTAGAYVSANTDTDVAAKLQAIVRAATGVTGATVTEKTLALADFA